MSLLFPLLNELLFRQQGFIYSSVLHFAASSRIVISFCHGYESQDLYYKEIRNISALEYIIHLPYKWSNLQIGEERIQGDLKMWAFIPSPNIAFYSPEMCPTPKSVCKIYLKIVRH